MLCVLSFTTNYLSMILPDLVFLRGYPISLGIYVFHFFWVFPITTFCEISSFLHIYFCRFVFVWNIPKLSHHFKRNICRKYSQAVWKKYQRQFANAEFILNT